MQGIGIAPSLRHLSMAIAIAAGEEHDDASVPFLTPREASAAAARSDIPAMSAKP